MAFEKQLQQKSLNICNEQPDGMSFSLVSGISSIANNEYISITNNILSHGLLALSQTICFSLMIFSLVVKVSARYSVPHYTSYAMAELPFFSLQYW